MSTPSEKFVQPAIPKFDGYYDFWSMTMENFLRSREMWSLVEEGIPTMAIGSSPANEAQRKAVEEAKLKDLKVKNFLFQAIDREILETILDKGTSKAIWESMKRKYQGSTKVRRAQLQALKREFELLAMKEGEKIDTFLGRTLSVVNKMKINGESVEQSTIVSKILRSLTRKFNYVVCSIEESNDLSTLTIDELHGSLLVHEGRMQEPQEEEHVLNVSQDERSSYGRGRGSLRGGRGRGRGRATPDKASIECFKCHKLGHFQYECPDWEKGAYYAELEEDVLLMALVSFEEEENVEENETGGDGGASGEDGEALETGKERGRCHDLSNDVESAKVCVKFAEACKEEEWLEVMRCELQAIQKNETWDLASSQVDVKKMEAKWCELQDIEKNQTGSLMPHMMYVADLISQFMAKSKEEHMLAAKSVLTYLKRTVDFRRTQHIDVRYHYLCDLAKQEVVKLVFCGTGDQVADIMTKPVKLEAFIKLREKLGVCNRVN
ncbi:Zinc finger CCHC-type superfamily [Arabidopsis suecica]|uniref:Zinc finger CCHC-type superfamily n=1 Tax=Arabidopsis suecica TaxID=45249 RepID=A0A8T2CNT2_ARASU|nr:Zinc finger CCHC-type superfamily [Arabidopsis suecica]